jgi:hypothetical protein
MRGAQRLGNLNSQLKNVLDHQRLPGNTVFESLALQQLHRDERSSIGLVNFVDRANVRVVQGRRGFGFPLKTAKGLCIVGEFIGKELQGDVARRALDPPPHTLHPYPLRQSC